MIDGFSVQVDAMNGSFIVSENVEDVANAAAEKRLKRERRTDRVNTGSSR